MKSGYWPQGYDVELNTILDRLDEARGLVAQDPSRSKCLSVLEVSYKTWLRDRYSEPPSIAQSEHREIQWLECRNNIEGAIKEIWPTIPSSIDVDYERVNFIKLVIDTCHTRGFDSTLSVSTWGICGLKVTRFGSPMLIINDFWHTPLDYGLLFLGPSQFTGRQEEYSKTLEMTINSEESRVDCSTYLELFKKPKRIWGNEETIDTISDYLEQLVAGDIYNAI